MALLFNISDLGLDMRAVHVLFRIWAERVRGAYEGLLRSERSLNLRSSPTRGRKAAVEGAWRNRNTAFPPCLVILRAYHQALC